MAAGSSSDVTVGTCAGTIEHASSPTRHLVRDSGTISPMSEVIGTRTVVCDDDGVLRGVISQLVRETGYEVVGEAESPADALAEVSSKGADVVVLDLALRGGHGEHLMKDILDARPDTRIIVFSAYVSNPMSLLDAGASAVVEKPDFTRLEEVLTQFRTQSTGSIHENRRRPVRELQPLPTPRVVSISGFETWESFRNVVDRLVPGDALLAMDILPPPSLRASWDEVFRVDYRVHLARAAAALRREQDRISISPDGFPVLAIIAGHREAPAAVFSRLESRWHREIASGSPVGSFAHLRNDETPLQALERIVIPLSDGSTTTLHPLRMN